MQQKGDEVENIQFKPIQDFPNYGISPKGEVLNMTTGMKLKPWISMGYKYVCLIRGKEKKKFRVHRLVALAYIPNPNKYPIVNHIDENKLNNDMSNLEWCTYRYNLAYGKRPPARNIEIAWEKAKKRVIQLSMTEDFIKEYESIKDASVQTGILSSTISHCLRGDCKHAGGFIWQYGSSTF